MCSRMISIITIDECVKRASIGQDRAAQSIVSARTLSCSRLVFL
jgi:hypothetical protein